MPNLGVPGLILIVAIALLLFGPKKLPELGRAEFKSGARKLIEDAEMQEESKPTRKEDKE